MADTKAIKETAKEKTVKIRLPRIPGADDMFVGINGKTYLIKRGVEVEVPEAVAKVIRRSEEQDEKAYLMKERYAEEFASGK